jgi:spore maturation protein SpmB
LLTTFFSSLVGLLSVSIFQRINLLNRIVLLYLGGITTLVTLIIYFFIRLSASQVEFVSRFGGNFILVALIIFFLLLGIRSRINLYETFIEGARQGFGVAIKIIPYLVAMLVAIGVFRASGAMDILTDGIGRLVHWFGLNTDFVPALPTGFMKPLSGSGARGMMVEAMEHYGPDSFVGRLACTFQGSTETTFYTIAVYYGAVNIRKTRYTVTCGLLADLTSIVAGIIIAYIFFG